jgi:dUTP pyrophosphatase
LSHGARIAQMIVAPVVQARFELVEALDETRAGRAASARPGCR